MHDSAAKADRLRQAKDEAQKEVSAYRSQRTEQFERQCQAVRSDTELSVIENVGCAFPCPDAESLLVAVLLS